MLRVAPVLLAVLLGCAGETPGKGGPPGDADDTAPSPCEPTARLTASRIAGTLPLTATFEGVEACGGGWDATWSFGDGGTDAGPAVTHTFLATGTFSVTLTLTSPDGDVLTDTTTVTVSPAACPEVVAPVQVGTLADPALTEASGLVEGLANPGVLWTHNDSGDTARLFALAPDGAALGTFLLDGADAGDWEDLAVGELDGAPTLFVGDVGNGVERDTVAVYVVPEPTVGGGGEALVSDWWRFELAFPDTPPPDGGALLWDPATGDLLLAVTAEDAVEVWRAPAPFAPDAVVLLERIASFPGAPSVTGGAASPLGDQLVLRSADAAWLWRRDRGLPIEAAFAGEACTLPIAEEVRGEALGFSADGLGYYTTSEEPAQPIWYAAFVPPCEGFEPAVVTEGALEVGAAITFGLDPACLPMGVASVAWDFDDGETSDALAPVHTFLASGTRTLTVTVEGGDGAVATVTTDVTINPASCPVPGATETWGTVASEEIVEASGLAMSTRNAGVVWTHNDSADTPRLFAMTRTGGHLAEFTVLTENRDWEDLALGWDATLGATALYVGDFGDNGSVRESVAVLVVPEPLVDLAAAPYAAEIADFSTLTLLYPDSAHNAETLLHDPVTGDLYVVTKSYRGETSVYRKPAPHVGGTTTTLEHVADLLFGEPPLDGNPATTGGAFSPLGDRIAIRTYSHAWMFRRDQAFSVADAFGGAPCDLYAPDEEQGEAITFSPDGKGYVTLSEGELQPIHYTPLD